MSEPKLIQKINELADTDRADVIDYINKLHSSKKVTTKKRVFGYAKGAIKIKKGFDDPIEL